MTVPIHKTDLRREDVLCGSGKALMHHPGNQKFRTLVKARVDQYFDSDRHRKAEISEEVVRDVEAMGGRFLKQDKSDRAWHVIGRAEAIDKTSQALRDMKRRLLRELHQEASTTTKTTANTSIISIDTSKYVLPVVLQQATFKGMSQKGDSKANKEKVTMRGSSDFNSIELTGYDVVCGSGRAVMQLPGNKAFRALVKSNVDRFVDGDRGISTYIVQEVIKHGGRFLKRDKEGSWCTIGQEEAVLKTSQALRDARRILLREREQGHSENNNNKELTDSTVTASKLTDSTVTTSTLTASTVTASTLTDSTFTASTLTDSTFTASNSDPGIEQDVEALEVANSLYQLSLGNFRPSRIV